MIRVKSVIFSHNRCIQLVSKCVDDVPKYIFNYGKLFLRARNSLSALSIIAESMSHL